MRLKQPNPKLQMSELVNFDIRADYRPYDGGLFSASWFYKSIDDPIEHVQRAPRARRAGGRDQQAQVPLRRPS